MFQFIHRPSTYLEQAARGVSTIHEKIFAYYIDAITASFLSDPQRVFRAVVESYTGVPSNGIFDWRDSVVYRLEMCSLRGLPITIDLFPRLVIGVSDFYRSQENALIRFLQEQQIGIFGGIGNEFDVYRHGL